MEFIILSLLFALLSGFVVTLYNQNVTILQSLKDAEAEAALHRRYLAGLVRMVAPASTAAVIDSSRMKKRLAKDVVNGNITQDQYNVITKTWDEILDETEKASDLFRKGD